MRIQVSNAWPAPHQAFLLASQLPALFRNHLIGDEELLVKNPSPTWGKLHLRVQGGGRERGMDLIHAMSEFPNDLRNRYIA